jgi:hypothetical protein
MECLHLSLPPDKFDILACEPFDPLANLCMFWDVILDKIDHPKETANLLDTCRWINA